MFGFIRKRTDARKKKSIPEEMSELYDENNEKTTGLERYSESNEKQNKQNDKQQWNYNQDYTQQNVQDIQNQKIQNKQIEQIQSEQQKGQEDSAELEEEQKGQTLSLSLIEQVKSEEHSMLLLGEILIKKGYITRDVLDVALKEQKITGKKIGETLLKAGFVPENAIAEALAEQLKVPFIEIRKIPVDYNLAYKFESGKVYNWQIIPFKEDDKYIHIAFANPSFEILSQVQKYVSKNFAKEVKIYTAKKSDVEILISNIYPEFSFKKFLEDSLEKALQYEHAGEAANPAIPSLVDAILNEAISQNATDIHLIYDGTVFRIFLRIDGMFKYFRSLPGDLFPKIISNLKQKAGMDPGDKIHVQDGHLTHVIGNRLVNIRASFVPLVEDGASIVLRILDESRIDFSLDVLGFYPDDLTNIKNALKNPYGLILVTGPTGSGKTTTLYSMLNFLTPYKKSILTIEDPVEFKLPFVRQVQVNRKADMTPANILRAFLRHDPDVILVGEIRDSETAEIVIQAAETGHLVLSTLHTNEAPSAILRLKDLGIKDISLSSALKAVIAQRLVRKICPYCKKEYIPNDFEKKYLENSNVNIPQMYKGEGCEKCNYTGYKGVTIIYEYLTTSEYDYELLKKANNINQIMEFAKSKGYIPMKYLGLKKVKEGITTLQEVIRICG